MTRRSARSCILLMGVAVAALMVAACASEEGEARPGETPRVPSSVAPSSVVPSTTAPPPPPETVPAATEDPACAAARDLITAVMTNPSPDPHDQFGRELAGIYAVPAGVLPADVQAGLDVVAETNEAWFAGAPLPGDVGRSDAAWQRLLDWAAATCPGAV